MATSRYTLVSFDVDGTLFSEPALTSASTALGIGAKWRRYDEMLTRKRITLKQCLDYQFKLLSGARLDNVLSEISKVRMIENIRETVEKLQGHGLRAVMLTDNPDFLCLYLVEKYGFDGYVSSQIRVKDGLISGEVVSMHEKLEGLRKYCNWLSIPLNKCIHIGDWVNDIPVFKAVGYSIAINARQDSVRKAASHVMQTNDLLDVYKHLQPKITSRTSERPWL